MKSAELEPWNSAIGKLQGTILALEQERMRLDRQTVDALITSMLEAGDRVSDLIFLAGKPPLVEIDGRLKPFAINTPDSLLTTHFIDALAEYIMNDDERLRTEYASTGSCDCSYAIDNVARFRTNIYKENRQRAIVMRKLQSTVPTLAELNLPPVFRTIIKERNGIVLVTGAAGSGKTTTLAAMINELNQTQDIHIVTLEDPVEFLHPRARAAISHRELGRDFRSFAEGLRSALRQAPKVILVGEIRDRETMEIALKAAETGHLVFSTLHTINAGQTINRIIGFFTKEEEEQLRYRLSDAVRYIVSQRLAPKVSAGRVLISEVIGSSLRTREVIRYGESEGKTFHEIIDSAAIYGWHTFDRCLLKAFEANEVSEETVLLYCNDKGRVRRDLDLSRKRRGEPEVEGMSPLKLDVVGVPKLATGAAAQEVGVNQEAGADSASGGTGSKLRVIQPRPQTSSQQAPTSAAPLCMDVTGNPGR
jgi:twitching motility protein PilT